MSASASLAFQIIFTCAFIIVLAAGVYLVRNDRKWFGHDANVPGDNASGRSYNRAQIYLIWLHAAVLTGAFAFLFH